MRRRRTKSTLALTAASLVLGTGCGAHDSSAAPRLPHDEPTVRAIDRAFWADAAAFCRPFLRYEDQHPDVAPAGMNPERPTRAQLGALLAAEQRTHDPFLKHHVWSRVIQRLGEPETGLDLWRPIARDLLEYDASREAQVDATRARDVRAWARAYRRTSTALAALGVDFAAASAPSSNACTRLFG